MASSTSSPLGITGLDHLMVMSSSASPARAPPPGWMGPSGWGFQKQAVLGERLTGRPLCKLQPLQSEGQRSMAVSVAPSGEGACPHGQGAPLGPWAS